MESCACPVSENTRCSCPNLTPCKWKTLPAKLTKHHDDRSRLALLFIALVISCLNFIRGISDYLTAVLDGKSGSSSQRHKRRKCPQNHTTLPFFFTFLFQPSQCLTLYPWQVQPAFTCLCSIAMSGLWYSLFIFSTFHFLSYVPYLFPPRITPLLPSLLLSSCLMWEDI